MSRYTKADFEAEYPNDDACLTKVMEDRHGDTCPKCGTIGTKFYRISDRKQFSCGSCKQHISPLADTIFRKSETSLKNWFYAIYKFSISKNGVAATELERELGVTYKTAWRMCREIRKLMAQEGEKLSDTVEADETYIGGKASSKEIHTSKTPVLGVVERGGEVRARAVTGANASTALPFLRATVASASEVITDESRIYNRLHQDYPHSKVNHSAREYVRGMVHTNTIEGFWGQMKRSIDGTYHCASPKYLQLYVNEFAFRYNHRAEPIAPVLLKLAAMPA